MRLICPRCGAHYEIENAAIPEGGRAVECSACDHVWRARRVDEAEPVTSSAPNSTAPTEPFDPAARPALSRPLSESVVGILREEAARELERRAELQRKTQEGNGTPPPAEVAGELIVTGPPATADVAPSDIPPRRVRPAGSPALPPVPDQAPASPSPTSTPPTVPQAVGYRTGFALATAVAAAIVAVYLATTPSAPDAAPGWRASLDQGRDWIARKADVVTGGNAPAGRAVQD